MPTSIRLVFHYAVLLSLCIFAANPARPVAAATLTVEHCLDDGSAGSLRSVVAAAASNDVVDLSSLTCGTLALGGGAIQIGSLGELDPSGPPFNLTLRGPGPAQLTLAGSGSDRLFAVLRMGQVRFEGLTLSGGVAPEVDPIDASVRAMGGCLFAIDDLSLKDAVLGNCRAMFGGGAFSLIGSVVAEDSEIFGNVAAIPLGMSASQAAGSAVMTMNGGPSGKGNVTLLRSRVHDNSATAPAVLGGALFVNGSLSLTDSRLYANEAHGTVAGAQGGGAAVVRNATITRSRVDHNTAAGGGVGMGGGLYSANLALVITDSIVDGNRATGSNQAVGGGFYTQGLSDPGLILNSTFSANRAEIGSGGGSSKLDAATMRALSGFGIGEAAPDGFPLGSATGGAIAAQQALTIRNSTIAFNVSSGTGGGLMQTGSNDSLSFQAPLVIESSIVARNEAQAENDITGAVSDAFVVQLSGSRNIVQIIRPTIALPPDTLRVDPQLGPLADNGGGTLTHALRFGSPAIDAGSNPAALAFDQRGSGFPRTLGATTDIGAWEFDIDSIRYVVTPSVVGEGHLSPDTAQEVAPGEIVAFTLTPAPGHRIWSIGGTCEGALVDDVYTTTPIDRDCSVSVRFVDTAQIPLASITPGAIELSLAAGDSGSRTLAISNVGTGTLEWSLHEALAKSLGLPLAPAAKPQRRSDVSLAMAAPRIGAAPLALTGIAAARGSLALSQTSNLTPSPANSAACRQNDDQYTVENHYLRRFYFADHPAVGSAVSIESVDVGVESSTGQTLQVNLYTLPSGTVAETIPLADLVPIGSGSGSVADGAALTTVNVPVSAIVADTAANDLVVEVVGDGSGDGTHFYMGSTPSPETHLSFFMAPECGIDTPVTPSSIGFPNMHVILVVNVDDQPPALPGCTNPNDIPWLSASPLSGSTPAGAIDDVSIAVDAGGLAPGEYDALVCVASNDMGGHAPTEVPVHLSVTPPVDADCLFADGFEADGSGGCRGR